MRLFTFQGIGHDITKAHEPPTDYTDTYGPFREISQYLSWPYWVWCFQCLADFNNDWLKSFDEMRKYNTLWILDVPEHSIRWMGIDRQCNRIGSVDKWFFANPKDARAIGDIPQGLVNRPLSQCWILEVCEPIKDKRKKPSKPPNWRQRARKGK